MNSMYEALPSNLLCHQLDIYQLIRDNFFFTIDLKRMGKTPKFSSLANI